MGVGVIRKALAVEDDGRAGDVGFCYLKGKGLRAARVVADAGDGRGRGARTCAVGVGNGVVHALHEPLRCKACDAGLFLSAVVGVAAFGRVECGRREVNLLFRGGSVVLYEAVPHGHGDGLDAAEHIAALFQLGAVRIHDARDAGVADVSVLVVVVCQDDDGVVLAAQRRAAHHIVITVAAGHAHVGGLHARLDGKLRHSPGGAVGIGAGQALRVCDGGVCGGINCLGAADDEGARKAAGRYRGRRHGA